MENLEKSWKETIENADEHSEIVLKVIIHQFSYFSFFWWFLNKITCKFFSNFVYWDGQFEPGKNVSLCGIYSHLTENISGTNHLEMFSTRNKQTYTSMIYDTT